MVMIQGESLGQRAVSPLAPRDPAPLDEGVPLDAQSDDALLTRLRAGDEAAFRALVDRHRPWLVRLCTRLLGHDAHAAEDAAQESLLKLHVAARRDGRTLRVRPWLTVVARNTCVDEQRRRRPDLPGELPEQPVHGDDPFQLDAALADAWLRLAGRHREVLYLREVLGFSYKEIGAVMGLTMAATETLVFRARAALRREYERSGGSSFGCVLLGLQLARIGVDRRGDGVVADGVSTVVANDGGISGLTGRLAHFFSTSLPGCSEQAVAKVLSVAAGVMMAAASVTAGFGPFRDTPPAAADGALAAAVPAPSGSPAATSVLSAAPLAGEASGQTAATRPMTLKTLLGNAVPADWAPQRSHTEPVPGTTAGPAGAGTDARPRRITPLRDAAAAARSDERPSLPQGLRGDSGDGPRRSLLPDRPRRGDIPPRPHPLQALLSDPRPLLTDPLPADPVPADLVPVDLLRPEPAPTEPVPAEPASGLPVFEPEGRPSPKETLDPAIATFAGDEPAPVRLRDR